MCGMNWFREQMERADEDLNQLNQLVKMMEERYKLPLADPNDRGDLNPDIIAVYQEIVSRKNELLMPKTPQV